MRITCIMSLLFELLFETLNKTHKRFLQPFIILTTLQVENKAMQIGEFFLCDWKKK